MNWSEKMNFLAEKEIPFLFILDFELNDPLVVPLSDINPEKIRFRINQMSNSVQKNKRILSAPELNVYPQPYPDFLRMFQSVQRSIQEGNTYLLNLCIQTKIEISLSLREIFEISAAPYKLLWENRFVLFSPESFIKVRSGIVSTYPMKGTLEKINANSRNLLLNDVKEMAEHATITDLLRNDLGKIAQNIRVKKYRYIDEIYTPGKTILQVSSMIEGRIEKKYEEKPGDLFMEIMPAGSVTGAPKKKTVELIKQTENFSRGFYTGVFGVYDRGEIDSAVMIRFIEKTSDGYLYKSGAGITFMSDPEKEYKELMQKIYVPVY